MGTDLYIPMCWNMCFTVISAILLYWTVFLESFVWPFRLLLCPH